MAHNGSLDRVFPNPSGRSTGRLADGERAARIAVASAVAVVLAAPLAAHADASLTAAGGGELTEAAFELDVAIDGAIAVVTARQVITNPGVHPAQAVYTFDLPREAAVTGASVRLADGRNSASVVVTADAALTPVPNPDAVEGTPDLALVRLVARERRDLDDRRPAMASYEVRAYPIAPGATTTVTTRWIAPLAYRDGRLVLRIPWRGEAANLVRERVVVTARPPAGATGFEDVRGGGQSLGKRPARARFRAQPGAGVTVELVPSFGRSRAPIASFAAVPLAAGGRGGDADVGAFAISVLSPRPRGKRSLGYERMLLVVDASRSMGASGLSAARTLAETLISDLPQAAAIELIVFDRAPTRALGRFERRQGPARAKVSQLLAQIAGKAAGTAHAAGLANGSDLGAALTMARQVIERAPLPAAPSEGLTRGVQAPTLIAIVSDGMTPLDLGDREARDRLGAQVLAEADVLAITLVPDDAAMPDASLGPLATLAHETGGRSLAVRHGEVAGRARDISAELDRPAPLVELEVDVGGGGGRARRASGAGDARVALWLPRTLEAGHGVIAFGLYRGRRPARAAIAAVQAGRTVRLAARSDGALARAALPLALVGAEPIDMIDMGRAAGDDDAAAPGPGEVDGETEEAAERALEAGLRRASAVSRWTSIAAVDPRDAFARDRLALVKRWGPSVYTRLPAPPERAPGHRWRAFAERAAEDREAGERRPTGELDRDIIERLVAVHVMPKARACYEAELRRDRALAGSMTVVLELARGEVQYAGVERAAMSRKSPALEACVRDAAYSIQVPRVAQGDSQEAVGLVRYPIAFRMRDRQGEVRGAAPEPGEATGAADAADASDGPVPIPPVNQGDPLQGLRRD